VLDLSSGSAAEDDEEEYFSAPETDNQRATDVEEFLRGLSTDDLVQLKKYVADDLGQEPTEPESVVRRLSENDRNPAGDDIGELMVL